MILELWESAAGYSSPGVAEQADSNLHNPCSFPAQPKLTPDSLTPKLINVK